MAGAPFFIGNTQFHAEHKEINGKYVKLEGEDFYCIENYHRMNPFFISVVSSGDHWMFISSNGGLTAGRKDPSHALFPYYTDDKIHDSAEITGSKTVIFVEKNQQSFLWEPFSSRNEGSYQISRRLYKNIPGNKLIFEEFNEDLSISFSYGWYNSERFGFVRKSRIVNHLDSNVQIRILDGFQNILPSGINLGMQTEKSTLLDAYKKNELLSNNIAAFSLSSIPVDRPEPSESLRATLVWCAGIPIRSILLSTRQLKNFREALPVTNEKDIRAARGAYFVISEIPLSSQEAKEWMIVAELEQGPQEYSRLVTLLQTPNTALTLVREDVEKGTGQLIKMVASADGLQLTNDKLSCSRHFSNVLFNCMRGGIFVSNYQIEKEDFLAFLKIHNRPVYLSQETFLQTLPPTLSFHDLANRIKSVSSVDLERLCYEYLPLTFSRRHGDPSRPWNMFAIHLRDSKGKKVLNFQGNWRDIFQNWEALAYSFPDFTGSFICKFLNATTADGYNPYRVTRNGIEWEVHDPSDPWSFIGYWGDHQIIYLLRFLEISRDHHPEFLQEMLSREIFCFAHVPYKIKPYADLVRNPRNTIDFDHNLSIQLEEKYQQIGSDGKLMWESSQKLLYANLAEKLLIPLLTKLSNFIPEAGIWMNTQRPEWNDANNALVGPGASMVTLYYIRRYLTFCQDLFRTSQKSSYRISTALNIFLLEILEVFTSRKSILSKSLPSETKREICDLLGQAGEKYRQQVYSGTFSKSKHDLKRESILDFIDSALAFCDHSILANRRPDGLFHSYNLVSFPDASKIEIRYLYEMLEGQVAVLSSGILSTDECIALLENLRNSKLYVADRNSYLLYPDRQLKRFDEKNIIPTEEIIKSSLLQKLINDKNEDLILLDESGNYHFHPDFRNAGELSNALNKLSAGSYKDLAASEAQIILDLYEKVFDHQSFTGRSGSFYGYEGLGCIYWHMVSKLLLAVKENIYLAEGKSISPENKKKLSKIYYEIRSGIGITKSPEQYGAFPTDPYSHTPGYGGARQPGLTGQVKEDIISRWAEFGIFVSEGKLHFQPHLLRKEEILQSKDNFSFYSFDGPLTEIPVPPQSLIFTYCQIPIIVSVGNKNEMSVTFSNGKTEIISGNSLPIDHSRHIFARTGFIRSLHFTIPEQELV